MKIAVALLLIFGTANAGRLDKSYLPPGGTGGFLQIPYTAGLFNGAQGAASVSGSYHDYSGSVRSGQAIAITRYDNQNVGDGSYRYNYETANGIAAEETGSTRGDGQSVAGFYSYTGNDGKKYTVHYTADENGFHPEGDHLPTPPPIPAEIQRGVQLSLAAEARGENQGGFSQVSNKYLTPNGGGYSY